MEIKIKKINKIFICFFVYLICFVSAAASRDYQAEITGGGIHLSGPVIEGITSRINFSVTLKVEETGNVSEHQYIDLKEWKWENISNSFITVENLKNESGGGNKVAFKKKGDILDTVEFTLSGTFVFNWKNMNGSFRKRVKIGEMYTGKSSHDRFLGNVYLNLDGNIDFVSALNVKVLQDMDFGTITAGTRGSTLNSGEPAVVEARGVMGRDVKIIIPKKTSVSNRETNETLDVVLNFRNPKGLSNEGDRQSVTRTILTETEKNMGKTENIVIDGEMQTNRNSRGIYTGEFKVRAEYDY